MVAALGVVLAAALALVGVLKSNRATTRTTLAQQVIDEEKNAGQLALDLANSMSIRLESVETKLSVTQDELSDVRDELADERGWQDRVSEAWAAHERWDDEVLTMFEKAVPGATKGLSAKPELPPRPPRRRRRSG